MVDLAVAAPTLPYGPVLTQLLRPLQRGFLILIASFGIVGRLVVGDVGRLPDAEVAAGHRALPVVRIVPEPDEPPVRAGLFDPGGWGWVVPYVALGLGLCLWQRGRRSRVT